jgi:hypothetical protein
VRNSLLDLLPEPAAFPVLDPQVAVLELMRPFSANVRSVAGRLVVLMGLCLGLLPAPALGQGNGVYYFHQRTFEIPFNVDPNHPISKLFLHVSTDGKNYNSVAAAAPGAAANNAFTYEAKSDGWYYFVVQFEDTAGRRTPEKINGSPPQLSVCVDTIRPTASLKAVPVPPKMAGHTVAVEWEVNDVNLDRRSLRLQYAPQGSDRWTPLVIEQLPHAQFSWAPPPGSYDVRLDVADLAKNSATATTRVTTGTAGPYGAADAAAVGGPKVLHVRSKKFQINYRTDTAGRSGIARVEIWLTRDTNLYSRYKANAPANGPCDIEVPTAGRYGFTVRPINGVGRGPDPPSPRQQPQVWVEVDDTAPLVTLHSVVVGEGKDDGWIIVNWQALDKWLVARPITISYATSPTGPWLPFPGEQPLENSGSCRLQVTKELPFELYVQVKAKDQAGNEGVAVSKEAVKVDPHLPKVIIDSVGVGGISVEGASIPPK